MKTLFVRDFITQRWVVLLASVYSLFFIGLFALAEVSETGSLIYVVSGIGAAMMVTFGSFKADRNNTLVTMLSLPVTRRDVVNEKFLLLLVMAFAGLACGAFFGFVAHSVGLNTALIVALDLVRVIAGVGLLSAAIPIYLRFGHKAIQVAMVAILAVGVLLQLGLGIALAVSPATFGGMLDALLAWYRQTPITTRNLYWLVAGGGTLVVSYVVSMVFYPRRDVQ